MIMNISEYVNGAESMSAEASALVEKIAAEFKAVFPNGWFRASREALGGKGVYIYFGAIDDVKSMGYRENDPMHHVVHVSLGPKGWVVELGSGGKLYLRPAPGSNFAMDSVKIGFRKISGDDKKVVAGLTKYFAKAREVFDENAENVYGRARYDDKFFG